MFVTRTIVEEPPNEDCRLKWKESKIFSKETCTRHSHPTCISSSTAKSSFPLQCIHKKVPRGQQVGGWTHSPTPYSRWGQNGNHWRIRWPKRLLHGNIFPFVFFLYIPGYKWCVCGRCFWRWWHSLRHSIVKQMTFWFNRAWWPRRRIRMHMMLSW